MSSENYPDELSRAVGLSDDELAAMGEPVEQELAAIIARHREERVSRRCSDHMSEADADPADLHDLGWCTECAQQVYIRPRHIATYAREDQP
jgi:hypothetical protein